MTINEYGKTESRIKGEQYLVWTTQEVIGSFIEKRNTGKGENLVIE